MQLEPSYHPFRAAGEEGEKEESHAAAFFRFGFAASVPHVCTTSRGNSTPHRGHVRRTPVKPDAFAVQPSSVHSISSELIFIFILSLPAYSMILPSTNATPFQMNRSTERFPAASIVSSSLAANLRMLRRTEPTSQVPPAAEAV